MIIVYNTTIS